jgi:LmbE family N-acetylglucosaminyl deacetylase
VPNDPLLAAARSIIDQLGRQQPGAQIYVPLGVGNHVDHQLVCAAGRAAHDAGVNVVWYEDAPYAAKDPAAVDARLQALADQFVPDVALIGAVLQRKLGAIRAYASQLGELFGARSSDDVMTTYAAAINPRYGERAWRRVKI